MTKSGHFLRGFYTGRSVVTKKAHFLQGGNMGNFESRATVWEFCRAERMARALAHRLERGAAREAVRARRLAAQSHRMAEEGQGFLMRARARLGAHVAARRAQETRRTADRVSRRLERIEAALSRSHEREARRMGLIGLSQSSMLDAWA